MYYIMHWRDKMGVITSLQPFGQKKRKKETKFFIYNYF